MLSFTFKAILNIGNKLKETNLNKMSKSRHC